MSATAVVPVPDPIDISESLKPSGSASSIHAEFAVSDSDSQVPNIYSQEARVEASTLDLDSHCEETGYHSCKVVYSDGGMLCATAAILDTVTDESFDVSPLLGDRPESTVDVTVHDSLSPAQKRVVQSLMQYFRGILNDKPGRTTLTEHSITLRTDKPIGVRPYPIPLAKVSTIEREVDKMLRIGVIEPAKSPLLLVNKSDGTNRPVVDFRLLNKARYSMLNQCLIPSSYSPD